MSTERLPDGAAGMGDQCPGGAEAAVARVGRVAAHRRRTASGADALTARERRGCHLRTRELLTRGDRHWLVLDQL